MDEYLSKPGWMGEGFGLSTRQGTLSFLRTVGGREEGMLGYGREMIGGEEVETLVPILYNVIKLSEKKAKKKTVRSYQDKVMQF